MSSSQERWNQGISLLEIQFDKRLFVTALKLNNDNCLRLLVLGLIDLKAELPNYLTEIKRAKSQPGKEIIFTRFIERVFGIKPETITMEVPVSSKILLVRGRVDAVFGNILMEFKLDLKRELDEAKDELTKYFQAYYEKNPIQPYIGMAHDGLLFRVFQPVFSPQLDSSRLVVTAVKEIDSLDIEHEQNLERVFLWFDSYLFVSDKAVPTSEDIKRRLGTQSPTFYGVLEKFDRFFNIAMSYKRNRVKYENWAKTLEVVYGDKVEEKSLFIKHTYLATLAKLLVHLIVAKPKSVSVNDVRAIVYGDLFNRYNISNFIEEDFYTWILDREIRAQAIPVIFSLMKELMIYDLEKVDEDFLKSLYEELVDPEVRHDLGEYYTPDWLAQYVIDTTLIRKPEGSVLDPACGSGTFLFSTLREKVKYLRSMGKSSEDIIEHVTRNVVGADVHPLAVIIARTNYLLAIRNLLQQRGNAIISIPVYLCDTLRLPEITMDLQSPQPEYRVATTENIRFSLPSSLTEDPQMLDRIVDRMGAAGKEYERLVEQYGAQKARSLRNSIETGFESSLKSWIANPKMIRVFANNLVKLLDLVEQDANSIWSFILKNVYKPIALSNRKFDFVVGNPPWLTMRQMKSNDYQDFLKKRSKELGLVDSGSAHLISLIELASLFFIVSSMQYLNEEGTIAFVMPKGVMVASQHEGFRNLLRGRTQTILDLEEVTPLFNIASCVVIASKHKIEQQPNTLRISGSLPRRNVSLPEARRFISFAQESYTAPEAIVKKQAKSFYHSHFHLGASIQPRRFWCIRFQRHDVLGSGGTDVPAVESDPTLDTKPPWSEVSLAGSTESQFVFATVTGNDLIPFGVLRFRPLLLPVLSEGGQLRVVAREQLTQLGFMKINDYLQQAEQEWAKHAQTKSKKMTIYQRLDYMKGVSSQNASASFKVIYGASGTNLAACVIDQRQGFNVYGFMAQKFIADKKTYFCDLDSHNEALYLSSVLNSNYLNKLIKPLQSRGLWGARDIHKRPLLFPIPKFDANNRAHITLAELGRRAHAKILKQRDSFARYSNSRARQLARQTVSEEIAEIDHITSEVLSR